jgi:uncharacterized protein YndB with AHSA1/START domain
VTETTPSVVDEEHFSVTRTVFIHASLDKVWAALTRADLLSQWFGSETSLDELAVGGAGVFGFPEYGQFNPIIVTAVDEGNTFGFRWGPTDEPLTEENTTEVTFSLLEIDGGTSLTVVETGFEKRAADRRGQLAELEDHRGGWDSELDELVALLELSAS